MKLTGIFLLFLIFKSFPTIFKEENAYKVSATTAINAKAVSYTHLTLPTKA